MLSRCSYAAIKKYADTSSFLDCRYLGLGDSIDDSTYLLRSADCHGNLFFHVSVDSR